MKVSEIIQLGRKTTQQWSSYTGMCVGNTCWSLSPLTVEESGEDKKDFG